MNQITFKFPFKTSYYKEDFYVSSNNFGAYKLIESWPDWPGKNINISIREACNLRFRPIMMTSISTMIAMLPLVIGNIGPGAGEASRLAVGSTILGGMIISTFFTLYVTPTMYLALAKNTKRIDAVDLELKKELAKK